MADFPPRVPFLPTAFHAFVEFSPHPTHEQTSNNCRDILWTQSLWAEGLRMSLIPVSQAAVQICGQTAAIATVFGIATHVRRAYRKGPKRYNDLRRAIRNLREDQHSREDRLARMIHDRRQSSLRDPAFDNMRRLFHRRWYEMNEVLYGLERILDKCNMLQPRSATDEVLFALEGAIEDMVKPSSARPTKISRLRVELTHKHLIKGLEKDLDATEDGWDRAWHNLVRYHQDTSRGYTVSEPYDHDDAPGQLPPLPLEAGPQRLAIEWR